MVCDMRERRVKTPEELAEVMRDEQYQVWIDSNYILGYAAALHDAEIIELDEFMKYVKVSCVQAADTLGVDIGI